MNKPELQNKYQLFIDGQWRDASDGTTFSTKCPANGEKLADCAQAAKEEVDDAVAAIIKDAKSECCKKITDCSTRFFNEKRHLHRAFFILLPFHPE